jgi:hypothetical protein
MRLKKINFIKKKDREKISKSTWVNLSVHHRLYEIEIKKKIYKRRTWQKRPKLNKKRTAKKS